MKAPKPGEPMLIHFTSDTRHTIAIRPENFDPRAVEATAGLLSSGAEFAGVHFTVEDRADGIQFTVWAGKHAFASNFVQHLPSSHGLVLRLTTQMLPGAIDVSRDLLLMAADAEQCAAIALAADLGITIPGFKVVKPSGKQVIRHKRPN